MKVGKRGERGTCSTADIFAHEQSDTCMCYTENKKEFGLSLSWAPESMGALGISQVILSVFVIHGELQGPCTGLC